MADLIIYADTTAIVPATPAHLAGLISAWVTAKRGKTDSARTEEAYRDTLMSFRAAVQAQGLDIDGRGAPDAATAITALALIAEGWAAIRHPRNGEKHAKGPVAPSTFNQRLAIVSSFYAFARKRGVLLMENPIGRLDRRAVQPYAKSHALDVQALRQRLSQLDRTTLAGKRDYALLACYATTGQRLREIGNLQLRDVARSGVTSTVTFRRVKGGKVVTKTLPAATSRALWEWLDAFYGQSLTKPAPDAPLWVSLSTNGSYGRQLDVQSIADVCAEHLGISKVHILRHTFAMTMERAGAALTEIQAQLGHANVATTGIYVKQLQASENRYGDTLAQLMGLGE